ncbi:MAG: hypothetical protein JWO94_507 [Verrucomicrobiaceae bacterium]|nr:hypothetical protein [Verrucomicrobiaceae bacterium]
MSTPSCHFPAPKERATGLWPAVLNAPLWCVLFVMLAVTAHAQWQSPSYALKSGWNAIYLHGDATYAPPATVFASSHVAEVWRWNPNPNQVQFTTTPLIPSSGTAEWTVWKSDGSVTALSQLLGQTAYLVKCDATTPAGYTLPIAQRMLPPTTNWVRNGANLMGFPSKLNSGAYPLFSNYFSTFPAVIAANVKIFKYVGGDLGAANPLQVFAPTSERLDRNQAYWFDSEVVGNFYAPVDISVSNRDGLDFGRTGAIITVNLLNRSSTASTVTIAPVASGTAPAGQESVFGGVPVTFRTYNAGTSAWTEAPITSAITQVIGPNSTVTLSFGINRADATMTGAPPESFFASLLRFTDSANLYDIQLPVRAHKASLAGLWIGDAQVTDVESKGPITSPGTGLSAPTTPGTATGNAYPLRYIFHVADDGTVRLLSQVYMGTLAAAPNAVGICTKESGLKSDSLASARRIVSAHLPLDRVLTAGSGSFALPGTLARTITIPFDDPVNPFVHEYHPDHDNKSAAGAALPSGQESYTINRAVSFTFSATAPPGVTATGYGSKVIAGTYAETITGLHKDSIVISGTFQLNRVSETGSITVIP